MRRGALAAGLLVCMAPSFAPAAIAPGVVPQPAEVTMGEGAFPLDDRTSICVQGGVREGSEAARYFIDLLARSRGLHMSLLPCGATAQGVIFARAPGFAPEGYRLDATPQRVTITGSSGAGLFYGAVTLWQLMSGEKGPARVSAQVINDTPVYAWRGLMLDSSRHFQSPAFVKSMIDWMALHKLNVFHWHLTDDQGWRLEIRKYPRLTSVGAWHVPAGTKGRYGGFYTQAQVRDIVSFAATRHVQVIPEVDLPGHAQAAIAAYPALGSTQGPPPAVSGAWGIHHYLFNPEPSTFTFLEDVLTEVMELFPSHYIHVGGDEAVKDQWINSPAVQARAHSLGISDMGELQAYFTQEIGRFLASHGRRLVGWDEILHPGLSRDAVVMSWRGTTGAHAAAVAGNDTVLSPWPTLYFDNQQSNLTIEPPGRMKVISLEDVYRFEPNDASLTAQQQAHVLGLQANIWTEHIRTEERVEWMAFPRAAAVAEVAWSPKARRQWPDFLTRLAPTLAKLRTVHLQPADSVFAVDARTQIVDSGNGGVDVTLTNQAGFGQIHYSTDGHDPTAASAADSSVLHLPLNTDLRAATFDGDIALSDVWRRQFDASTMARRTSRELSLCSDGVALLLEPAAAQLQKAATSFPIFALDIMNPCWIYHDVDLSHGAKLTVSVGQLPFNFEIGTDAQKIRVGDARTPNGELEVRVDGCDREPAALEPLSSVPAGAVEEVLQPVSIPTTPGRHDLCIRFSRPKLDPMWALDWAEISR
jgi:hexosaminidase